MKNHAKRVIGFVSVLLLTFVMTTAAFAAGAPGSPSASQEKLSKHQLNTLIATATTSGDHLRIAQYYQTQAQKSLALAQQHAQMTAAYRQRPHMHSDPDVRSAVQFSELCEKGNTERAVKLQALAQQQLQQASMAEGQE